MVPLVLLVHHDPPWSTFLGKLEKVWIRADRVGPRGPREPQPPLVDQERSGPPWTTLKHFPDAMQFGSMKSNSIQFNSVQFKKVKQIESALILSDIIGWLGTHVVKLSLSFSSTPMR